jgi:hypothetical protein
MNRDVFLNPAIRGCQSSAVIGEAWHRAGWGRADSTHRAVLGTFGFVASGRLGTWGQPRVAASRNPGLRYAIPLGLAQPHAPTSSPPFHGD